MIKSFQVIVHLRRDFIQKNQVLVVAKYPLHLIVLKLMTMTKKDNLIVVVVVVTVIIQK